MKPIFAFIAVGFCACTNVASQPVTAVQTTLTIAEELCTLDLSKAPTVTEAAKKYGREVVEYARQLCTAAELARPYANLLGSAGETAGLVSPLEEARQRAVERGQAAGVL